LKTRNDIQEIPNSDDSKPPDLPVDHKNAYGTFFKLLSGIGVACIILLAIYCVVTHS